MTVIALTTESIKGDTYTVHDAIEHFGLGRFQIALTFICGCAWMADSMEITLLSILPPSLECQWGITPLWQGLGTTCVFVGWAISSPLWGMFCDRFGRKKGLMLSAFLAASFGVCTGFAPNFTVFIILRVFVGIGIGGVPQSTTMCMEFLPIAHRAKAVIGLEVFWAFGACFEALLAMVAITHWGWRALVVLSALPLFIFGALCWWLPESPRFHASHGRLSLARSTLERVAATNKKTLPLGALITDGQGAANVRFIDLLGRDMWRTTILVWIIWMTVTFSYYGLSLYTTKLLQTGDQCHGGGTANSSIPEQANGVVCKQLTTGDYFDLFTTSFAEIPGLAVTAVTIEWLGRKKTMAFQFVLFSAANFVLLFCLSRPLMVAVIFVARAFISGAFQAAYVYTPEVYPTPLRGFGLGSASGWARVGAMITPSVAQVLSTTHLMYPVFVYGASGIVSAIAAMLLPIETKGRQITDSK